MTRSCDVWQRRGLEKSCVLRRSCVEGSVQVWDVAQGVESCSFPAVHSAATTALFFSPVNQLLLVSTGVCVIDIIGQ